ncbi:MAG TPA: molybdopterin-dependent oxidoreductase [Gemmatimonadaceae bacterium]|nr:molybdopterin-dependent oxidoreductase [Gemmatimonadaceae bacterium]
MRRRDFLSTSALALLAGCDRVLSFAERENEYVERGLFRHTARDVASGRFVTPDAKYPSYFISNTVPMWDATKNGPWSLEVSGIVAKPLTLSLDQLTRLPSTTLRLNHYCVEGWNAIASWTGVRLSVLAGLVQPDPMAQYVDFQSFDDGYHESWDLASAMHPQTLVAYGMDGHWLGAPHGGPARVFSPVKLGYKNTKYLTKIVFMPQRNGGYWSDQGYEWYGGT